MTDDRFLGLDLDLGFIADEEGTFEGKSATLSGQAYAAMRTAVEVVSPEEYEAHIEGLKAEIQAAQDEVASKLEEGSSEP